MIHIKLWQNNEDEGENNPFLWKEEFVSRVDEILHSLMQNSFNRENYF